MSTTTHSTAPPQQDRDSTQPRPPSYNPFLNSAERPSFPKVQDPSSIGPLYVLHFTSTNHTFRLPDFDSSAKYLNLPYAFVPTPARASDQDGAKQKCIEINNERAVFQTHREEAQKKEGERKEDHQIGRQGGKRSETAWKPDFSRPFMLAHLPDDESARLLLGRCVSLRSIWRLWSCGPDYQEVHSLMKTPESFEHWKDCVDASKTPSWKAHVFAYNNTVSDKRKVEVITDFSYMDFKGDIRLKGPFLRWGVMEEYSTWETQPTLLERKLENLEVGGGGAVRDGTVPYQSGKKADTTSTTTTRTMLERQELGDRDERMVQIFVGKRIDMPPPHDSKSVKQRGTGDPTQEGQYNLARDLIDRLSLKKRVYIGNTSMESEMSLLMASMALAGPGKICYDPFAGTGSLLYAAATFGAMTFGSDIDGRTMRGKSNKKDPKQSTGIMMSAKQYGLEDRILDCAVFDMTQSPWRDNLRFPLVPTTITSSSPPCCEVDGIDPSSSSSSTSSGGLRKGVFDAIIADPPYGVRAGAKRLGKRDPTKQREQPFWMEKDPVTGEGGCWSHERENYVPPTRPYHLKDLIDDLLDYSYEILNDGGRLVFWLPDMIDEEEEEEGDSNPTTTNSGKQIKVELPNHDRRPRGSGRMRLVAHSLQDFGRWGRRLITMEKVPPERDVLFPPCSSDTRIDSSPPLDVNRGLRVGEVADPDLTGRGIEVSVAVVVEEGKGREQEVRSKDRRDEKGKIRANADPNEFRNRYFEPKELRRS
ncbi:hypothetical protein IE53DRAFT_390955 [Violaceomyces palustris]|uniref:Uncharacterized protein n=1 Tax=Violaceomyces palustris TaxID=1673888 RepID=A0ACD0NM76_9BASI|nr:hypothetical protein IE53DRAFT_390955 [Violaceomyces palustris]